MDQGTESERGARRSGRRGLPADVERLNVHVSASTMQALRQVADSNGVTITEATRWAIRLLKLVDDARRDGEEIHFINPGTKRTRVLELI